MKPVSQPCLRNQDPILQVIKDYLVDPCHILEIGCGTGQHAVYMAEHLPHLTWHATDRFDAIYGANLWIEASQQLPLATELDISMPNWRSSLLFSVDHVYSANVIHFVSMEVIQNMFIELKTFLKIGGMVFLYGPYNQNGFTSEGNARLDAWLKADIDKRAGIKEIDDIKTLAKDAGLTLIANHNMPANNHLLVFKKQG